MKLFGKIIVFDTQDTAAVGLGKKSFSEEKQAHHFFYSISMVLLAPTFDHCSLVGSVIVEKDYIVKCSVYKTLSHPVHK